MNGTKDDSECSLPKEDISGVYFGIQMVDTFPIPEEICGGVRRQKFVAGLDSECAMEERGLRKEHSSSAALREGPT